MTVFIHKGDAPLSKRQAEKRGRRMFDAQMQQWQREAGLLMESREYLEWANGWLNDNKMNAANNLFNHQLAAYRGALARLAQYRVAEGRPELTEDQPTGKLDADGNEITETVVVQTAIEPVEPTVERPVYDGEGNQTGAETVTNPAVVQDEAERAEAQAVIDATPQEVKDWAGV